MNHLYVLFEAFQICHINVPCSSDGKSFQVLRTHNTTHASSSDCSELVVYDRRETAELFSSFSNRGDPYIEITEFFSDFDVSMINGFMFKVFSIPYLNFIVVNPQV